MRRQFVLDEPTNRLLEQLAADRAGNRSYVVREAIRLYADMEARLDQIEAEPAFQRMMEKSGEAIRAGRTTPHGEVKRMSRVAKGKKR